MQSTTARVTPNIMGQPGSGVVAPKQVTVQKTSSTPYTDKERKNLALGLGIPAGLIIIAGIVIVSLYFTKPELFGKEPEPGGTGGGTGGGTEKKKMVPYVAAFWVILFLPATIFVVLAFFMGFSKKAASKVMGRTGLVFFVPWVMVIIVLALGVFDKSVKMTWTDEFPSGTSDDCKNKHKARTSFLLGLTVLTFTSVALIAIFGYFRGVFFKPKIWVVPAVSFLSIVIGYIVIGVLFGKNKGGKDPVEC